MMMMKVTAKTSFAATAMAMAAGCLFVVTTTTMTMTTMMMIPCEGFRPPMCHTSSSGNNNNNNNNNHRRQDRRCRRTPTFLHESSSSSSSSSAVVTENPLSASDFGTAMPPEESIYQQIGVPEEKIALGVEAEDILQYIGTRENLIEKILRDNRNFQRDRAELEADKFLMDADNLNAYIKYERTRDERGTAGGDVAGAGAGGYQPNFWDSYGIYVIWIIGGFGFGYARKKFIEPKFASGEWQEIHINLGGLFNNGGNGGVDVDVDVGGVDAAVSNVIDAVQTTATDAATSAL